MWCHCRRRSILDSSAVGRGMDKIEFSLLTFMVSDTQSQSVMVRQSTSCHLSTMAPQRWGHASTDVISHSMKSPKKGAERQIVLRTLRGSMSMLVQEKGPRRLVSGSAASAESMARSVGTQTMAPIQCRLAAGQFSQAMLPHAMYPFDAKYQQSHRGAISPIPRTQLDTNWRSAICAPLFLDPL